VRKVLITTCTALIAAIGAAGAAAAPAPILDGDFAAGAAAGTHVFGGDLYLNETIWENQDFASSPIGITWTTTPWTEDGSATVTGGALVIDGARVGTDLTFDGPQSLRFPATFSGQTDEHVGLGTDFADAPWAMFSSGGSGLGAGLYARTSTGGTAIDDPISGVDPTVQHNYEIRWTTSRVTFFVDGRLVSSQDVALPNGLRILASDLDADGNALSVDGVRLQNFVPSGTFVSRPLAAGPGLVAWGALTPTGDLDGAAFETRTGRTPAPDASWSAWQPLGPGGAVASPLGDYIQYRATLSSLGGVYGARLNTVLIGLDADRVAPSATITGLDAGRTSAKVAFASPDADTARFECKLDDGARQTCASPKVFTSLKPGSRHAVTVRAIDRVGNAGAEVTRAFVTDRAVGPRPKVTVTPRSVRVSATGRATFRVGCPRSARRCKVALQLERGRRVISTKRAVTVRGGRSAKLRVRLSKATRRSLRTHRRLRASAVIVARDTAGHHATRHLTITLRAPKKR
jgi:hypothetical protein